MNKKDNTIKESLFGLTSNDLLGSAFSIGLFVVDKKNNTITIKPGVYTLRESITFGILPETEVKTVECKMLIDVNCSETINESIAAHHDTS